jgi:hypothetical protein
MQEPNITLSPKHGVNPCIPACFFCGKDKNILLLMGRINEADDEAPKNTVFDQEPCNDCAELLEQGFMLIVVENGTREDDNNPPRTGQQVVVKQEAAERLFDTPPKCGWSYIHRDIAQKLGIIKS